MLYNGVELPNIDSVWTDKTTYPYAAIENTNRGYMLTLYGSFVDNYRHVLTGTYYIYGEGSPFESYVVSGDSWKFNTSGASASRLSETDYIWSSFSIYTDSTMSEILHAATAPVDPNAPVGTMEIQTVQPLDVSVSFTVFISGVDFTSASYTLKYILSVDGQEVKSEVSDPFEDSATGLHGTLYGLTPETTYDLTCVLQKDGVDTSITASTTFTTLAGSGAGEGEGEDNTPDYSGQLGDIEQGLDDVQESVDKVGTKLDGVQEAVGAVKDAVSGVKEEVASLPNKIATAILDGIKKLFVPSQEDLSQIKTDYEDMLSAKLGFVWQAFDLLTTFVGELQNSLESGNPYEFVFPGVSVPINGEELVFVAETPVSLENALMDVLRPVLGSVVSIVCVVAFVNMAHDYVLAIVSGLSAFEFENRRKEQ